MSREEILKFAKENYPIGTRFISADTIKQEVIMNDDLIKPNKYGWLTENHLIGFCKDKNEKIIDGRGIYLFYKGEWAVKVNNNYELW